MSNNVDSSSVRYDASIGGKILDERAKRSTEEISFLTTVFTDRYYANLPGITGARPVWPAPPDALM